MGKKFQYKVALVTGGGSGIGKAVALRLANGGASVVVSDINEGSAAAVAESIEALGGKAVAHSGDVADPDTLNSAVELAEKEYGALHLAFNNAGISGPTGQLTELTLEDYRRVIDVDLNSVFYGMYYEIPAIERAGGGAIVNTSSILGLVGAATEVPYVAAKHGVTGMTRAAAREYSSKSIRINSIHPGNIDTSTLRHLGEEAHRVFRETGERGRFGTEEEVAEVVAFLLSDKASFVSGAQWEVDGGFVTH